MNKRIQRKRVKGWKAPENCVYVGRPTKWGNPYKVTKEEERNLALIYYREWLENMLKTYPYFLDELKGKDLMCWCPLTKPCHADILLEYLNKNNHRMDEYGKT